MNKWSNRFLHALILLAVVTLPMRGLLASVNMNNVSDMQHGMLINGSAESLHDSDTLSHNCDDCCEGDCDQSCVTLCTYLMPGLLPVALVTAPRYKDVSATVAFYFIFEQTAPPLLQPPI